MVGSEPIENVFLCKSQVHSQLEDEGTQFDSIEEHLKTPLEGSLLIPEEPQTV